MASECDDQYQEYVAALNDHVEKFNRLAEAELGLVNAGPIDFSVFDRQADLREAEADSDRRYVAAFDALIECNQRHRQG